MDKKKIKLYSLAYDNLYNLNSREGYKFDVSLKRLEFEVKKKGYKFVLNEKTQKFKCMVIK